MKRSTRKKQVARWRRRGRVKVRQLNGDHRLWWFTARLKRLWGSDGFVEVD